MLFCKILSQVLLDILKIELKTESIETFLCLDTVAKANICLGLDLPMLKPCYFVRFQGKSLQNKKKTVIELLGESQL